MSQQQSSSRQPTNMPAWDWAQVPDMDLKVHTSDLEGTKQAKEAEKGKREALRKQKWAEAHHQKAEEACLERERQEQEEHERWEHEEHADRERQEAIEVAWRAVAAEAEAVQQSVVKDRGRVGKLQAQSWVSSTGSVQFNDWGLDQDNGGAPHDHDQAAMKRKKKCSWAMMEDSKGVTGGSKKQARTGGSWGSGRKKGQTGNEDDNDDDEIEEVPVPAVPQFKVACSHLIREASELGRQVVVMEQMVAVMELQALAVQAYMRHMMAPPLWPSVGQVGAVAGRVEMGARGSWSGIEWSELEVAEEPEESGSEGIKDVEGEQDMQE
ncbi:hypothetical protein F5141DRAFT_1209483 [Pisolithus sp. B1]|nr:hypothetical protein F5141DRAFT_1209483 [Pisolithus sp. B1]